MSYGFTTIYTYRHSYDGADIRDWKDQPGGVYTEFLETWGSFEEETWLSDRHSTGRRYEYVSDKSLSGELTLTSYSVINKSTIILSLKEL